VPIIDVVGIYISTALGVFDFFIQFSNIVPIIHTLQKKCLQCSNQTQAKRD